MPDSSYLLPGLVVFALLCGVRAHIDIYSAFVRGAKEGLTALLQMAPYLCAILSATALLRGTGAIEYFTKLAAPALAFAGIPPEAVGVALLRPLSGSAALAGVRDIIARTGADSRAARFACVISGASETIFFTGSLYMGSMGAKNGRRAAAIALAAYAMGLLTAAVCV